MCGILGIMPAVNVDIFRKALRTLAHRGPDDEGIEIVDNSIILGHRRLSILDLSSAGKQPMYDASGRCCIVYNGEIYNYIEIRQILEKKGYKFKTNTDTEVILNSYIEWGPECVHKFIGMWAFAIWDSYKKELFLSRDRFGKKPLFYAKINDIFIFASEMKAIFPFLPDVRPSSDFYWMKNHIFEYEATDKCLVEHIKRFPKGSNGLYRNGNLQITRYWNTLDHLINVPQDYNKQVEMFREIFFDACKIRTRSDVQVATALSGGLDSSSVVAFLSHAGYKNKAFVASFPNTPIDETLYARQVVQHLGIEGKFVEVNPLEYWENIEKYIYMFEDIYITSPVPMIAIYGEMKRSDISVSIDGHGADELFSGYGHIIETLWDVRFSISKTIDVLTTLKNTWGDSPQFKRPNLLNVYVKYILKKLIKKLLGKEKYSVDKSHPNFKALDNLSQTLYTIFHDTILPTLLRNYDRYSMINGVEVRMPFMDHRIVTFVFSLPYSSKIGKGYTKKLLRDAVEPYLPSDIVWRKTKVGFNSPVIDWMRGPLKNWFLDIVHSKEFLECPLIENPDEVRQLTLNIINGKVSSFSLGEIVWTNISIYLWEKAVIKGWRNYLQGG